MKTISFEILEKSELPAAQAHAILKVMESELASAQETLATKADILAVKGDLAAVKADLKAEISALAVKVAEIEGRLSRWVLTCILGQTAVLAGLGYFVVSRLAR